MKHRCATVLLASLISLGLLAIGCEEPRGSVQGTVYLQDNTPGTGLVVRAVRPEYPGILVRTDDVGGYRFSDIPAGAWSLEFFDERGWQVGLESIEVVRGETLTLDFTIGEKPLPEGLAPSRIEGAP